MDMQCAGALRYITVERSTSLRGEQAGRIPIQPLENVLSPIPSKLRDPLVGAAAELPEGKFTGVVFANELLDNMPFDLYERQGRHWFRVLIAHEKRGRIRGNS